MPIEFDCPHCSKFLTTEDHRSGSNARCPACNEIITVPTRDEANAAAGARLAELDQTTDWSSASIAAPIGSSVNAAAAPAMESAAPSHLAVSLVSHATPASALPAAGVERQATDVAAVRVGPRPAQFCPSCGRPVDPAVHSCAACGTFMHELRVGRMDYASFSRRAVAMLIDLALLAAVGAMLHEGLGIPDFVSGVIWLVYFSLMESSAEQATLGKMALGIRVCDSDGVRNTLLRALARNTAKVLSGIACGIGYLLPLFTERKQALHDLIADCVVVRK